MLQILHSRAHAVSHSQIDLLAVGGDLAEMEVGGTLVGWAPGHIKVATAWDSDGQEPFVEIVVTGYGALSGAGIHDLIALSSGYLDVVTAGLHVGNFITADLATVDIPAGRYAVTVFADKLESMTARRVHFHFRAVDADAK